MKADIVVQTGEDPVASLEAVSRAARSAVGRVIAVGPFATPGGLDDLPAEMVILRKPASLGRVGSWNLGLFLRGRDVLVIGHDVRLREGALEEMLEVLHSSDRIAAVVPLVSEADDQVASLPRFTEVPTAKGPCVLLRSPVLNMIGAFDPAFERPSDAQEDWSLRAQRMGFRHVRANHAVALGPGGSRGEAGDPRPALLLARHPHLPEQEAAAMLGAEGHAAEHFLAARRGELRICASLTGNTQPLQRFQVFYQSTPIHDPGELLAILEMPCHLVVGDPAAYPNRALLFGAAHSAQAVLVASERERSEIVAELALDPAAVETVESAADLMPLFRKIVDHPRTRSMRYRAHLASYLRTLHRVA